MERYVNVNLKPQLRKLELATKYSLALGGVIGKYNSFFKGRGVEFDSYRDYTTSDSSRFIDWKASIRTNKVLLKQFTEEKNLTVFLLLDVSDNMIFGSTEKLKNEFAAEVSAQIGYNTLANDDSFGYALFDDKIIHSRLPKKGNKQFFLMQKALTDPDSYGGKCDMTKALKFTTSFLAPRSVVIIVSDFLYLDEESKSLLKIMSQQFEMVCLIVRDPIEYKLPKGLQIAIGSPNSNKTTLVDTNKIGKSYTENAKQDIEDLGHFFTKMRIDFVELPTDKPYLDTLRKFFIMRQKRWT